MEFKSIGVFLFLVLSLFLLLGCTQQSICGDTLCSVGEENTCPTDCATPINGNVFVSINGANDATDLTLEYYSSSNVNINLYNTISSSLASNWNANNSKNLSVSLNQNDSVTKPIPESRQLILEGLKQGEYYFTARNSDYSYYGKAEKVLISEDKDYYVKIELKANQPIVKIIAVDESEDLLMGSGKIEVFEISTYYDSQSNTSKTSEVQVGIVEFNEEQEMKALFNLWPEKTGIDYQTHFKAVVTKDNYGVGVYDYLGVQDKYNSISVPIIKEKPTTGSLKIQIVPGLGTTLVDLEILKGKELWVYGSNGEVAETITNDLTLSLIDYQVGEYYFSSLNYDINVPPVQLNSYSFVIKEGVNDSIKLEAFLGIAGSLSVVDSQSNLISKDKIQMYKICYSNIELPSCYEYNGKTWDQIYGRNPYPVQIGLNSEKAVKDYSTIVITFSLGYDSQVKDFNFSFKQGWNDIIMKFNPIYACAGEIDPNALLYKGDDLDLTANFAKVLVNANTSAKCEYYCKEGYYLNQNKCVFGVNDINARALWKKATPFAILDWNRTGTKLSLSVKNTSTKILYLKGVYLNVDANLDKYVATVGFSPSQIKTILVNLNTVCAANGTYLFSKDAIKIKYSTFLTSTTFLTQLGAADILGKCN